ncbi:hypothetical protein O181_033695 [Austropuccinia psidii MF-1]|uniref:Uncharacterized protein n=1 Tax=Austropuccinia psidii MF-1 TaxID=1389203 RepID=A0A9Q3D1P7_9BASI|nr:hypothetical protein [Austropuccinia psidii MF-1]
MNSISPNQVEELISRISNDITPLVERCQRNDKRIAELKESFDPHVLSSTTALTHLNHLRIRSHEMIETIDQELQEAESFFNKINDDFPSRNQQNESAKGVPDDLLEEHGSDDNEKSSVLFKNNYDENKNLTLFNDDRLKRARQKLQGLAKRLDREINRQRNYEIRLARNLRRTRRIGLIVLTVFLLMKFFNAYRGHSTSVNLLVAQAHDALFKQAKSLASICLIWLSLMIFEIKQWGSQITTAKHRTNFDFNQQNRKKQKKEVM